MAGSFVDPKTALDSVKSSSWKFFNFRVAGGDVDRSYVLCKLCFKSGNRKRGQVKYCGALLIWPCIWKPGTRLTTRPWSKERRHQYIGNISEPAINIYPFEIYRQYIAPGCTCSADEFLKVSSTTLDTKLFLQQWYHLQWIFAFLLKCWISMSDEEGLTNLNSGRRLVGWLLMNRACVPDYSNWASTIW